MFHMAFGATLRLHTTIVHLLIKDLNLEEWKRQLLDCAVQTEASTHELEAWEQQTVSGAAAAGHSGHRRSWQEDWASLLAGTILTDFKCKFSGSDSIRKCFSGPLLATKGKDTVLVSTLCTATAQKQPLALCLCTHAGCGGWRCVIGSELTPTNALSPKLCYSIDLNSFNLMNENQRDQKIRFHNASQNITTHKQ